MTETMGRLVIFLLFLASPVCAVPDPSGIVDVFLIPHSHDDVGWLQTVDQYFYQSVRYIYGSVLQCLLENPERKFSFVEVGYFERFWEVATELQKQQVRQVLANGQWEFNLGGITMGDEACVMWYDQINQMTTGAQFLQQNVGPTVTAKSAWHIDPFGHSAVTPSLWANAGFPGFVLNRIPYWLKDELKANQTLEFIWRGSNSLGEETQMWIHVLDSHYSSPEECAFDHNTGWPGMVFDPNSPYMQDDPSLFDDNLDTLAVNFANMVKSRTVWYPHNKLLIPFGDDFRHYQALGTLGPMDTLINYINANQSRFGCTVRYSHLSDYVAAVNALNLTWPVFQGIDFFPYVDSPDSYWTGYYTSRITLKSFVRHSDAVLQSAEQIYAFGRLLLPDLNASALNQMVEKGRQATSIMTHHDGITGTEAPFVEVDYTQRLWIGNTACDTVVQTIAARLLSSAADRREPRRPEVVGGQESRVADAKPLRSRRMKIVDDDDAVAAKGAASGAAGAAACPMQFVPGFDLPGYDLTTRGGAGPADCCQQCGQVAQCNAFAFDNGVCWLKNVPPGVQPQPASGVTCGFAATQRVAFYNALGWKRREVVSVPLFAAEATVSTGGQTVVSQVVAVPAYANETLPYRVFFWTDIPPLGFQVFTVTVPSTAAAKPAQPTRFEQLAGDTTISNEYLQLTFSGTSGRLASVTNKTDGSTVVVNQDFVQYRAAPGDNLGPSSNLYVFRPDTDCVVQIGANDGGDVKNVTQPYAYPYASAPVIVATAYSTASPPLNSTFAVAVRNAGTAQFGVNVEREDGGGVQWSQALFAYYINWSPETTPSGFQSGSASASSSSNDFVTVEVTFPTAFSAPPVVLLTPSVPDVYDVFVASTRQVSSTGFTANLLHSGGNGWSFALNLNWIAYVPTPPPANQTAFPTPLGGTLSVGPSPDSNLKQVTLAHDLRSINSIVLATARAPGTDDVFAVTVAATDGQNITFNVRNMNGASWSEQLELDWVVLRPTYAEQPVTTAPLTVNVVTGPIVSEVQQVWRSGYAQTVRLYSGDPDGYVGNAAELLTYVNPIDQGYELVMRFSTGLANNGTIAQDDSGLEFHTRSFNPVLDQLVSGNYYPMPSRAYIRDPTANVQVTLMSAASHAVGSVNEGEFEMMLQRRINAGSFMVINETLVVQQRLWLLASDPITSARIHRRLSLMQQFPAANVSLPLASTAADRDESLTFVSALAAPLPDNVHLLTLRALNGTPVDTILRLSHVFEKNEHPTLSQPVTVDLSQMFVAPFQLGHVREMNLFATMPKSQIKPLVWHGEDGHRPRLRSSLQGTTVTLDPMEIKTFLVELSV